MEYEQKGLFDEEYPKYEITNKIRLIELFAGISAQSMALKRLGVDFERHRAIEFDDFAMKSYNAICGTAFKPTDIRDIHAADLGITERDKYTYIMTYSFPCQALSLAGKQAGMTEGSGTTSSLLWEVRRLLSECGDDLPQILVMENVTQVYSEKNLPDFEKWIKFLRDLGYSNFYQALNAKDFGVPQNRDRCFMVSMLGKYDYEFPRPIPLEKVIVDVLEDDVDEKFFIRNEKAQLLIDQLIKDGKIEG